MLNKKIDGINKVAKNDLARSRSIVLDSIGEKQKKPKQTFFSPAQSIPASFDSASKVGQTAEFKKEEKLLTQKKDRKIFQTKTKDRQVLMDAIQPTRRGDSKIVSSEESLTKNKRDIIRAKDDVVTKTVKKPKKKKPKIFIKNKQKYKKVKKSFLVYLKQKKTSIRKKFNSLRLILPGSIKKSGFIFLLFFNSFIFLYLATAFLVNYYGLQNSLFGSLGTFVQIPAAISVDGQVLSYKALNNFYEKIASQRDKDVDINNLFRETISKAFIINKLLRKHNITSIQELKKVAPYDKEINLAPYNRILMIKKNIDSKKDFIKVSEKYGQTGQLSLSDANKANYEFSAEVLSLSEGETSDIISTTKALYIFHCFKKKAKVMELSYVSIPLNTLEEYLKTEVDNYQFWLLTRFDNNIWASKRN